MMRPLKVSPVDYVCPISLPATAMENVPANNEREQNLFYSIFNKNGLSITSLSDWTNHGCWEQTIFMLAG